MRRSGGFALVLLLCTSTLLAAQATGVGTPAENAYTINARMGLVIPALAHTQRSSSPQVIAKREQFTEYVLVLAVSANTSWELVASTLPHGVAIRDEHGAWNTADSSRAIIARGRSAHFAEVLLLVRVWREADADWESRLDFRVKPVEEIRAVVTH